MDLALENTIVIGFGQIMPFVNLAAAAVFATTGALVASRKEVDILGFLWLGAYQ